MGIMDSLSGLLNGTGPKTKDDKYQEALQSLLAVDVGRSAYFDVEITRFGSKYTKWCCHSAELPGESTATVNQKIYGVTEKFAVMTGYNDVTLSFYTLGSGTEYIRKSFFSWMSGITGRKEIIKDANIDTTYNVQYKNDYVAEIYITQYAIDGNPLLRVKLIDAFPVSINQIPLSWSAQNQAQSLNVSFAYTEYEYEFLYVEPNGAYTRGPIGELLGTAMRVGSAINTVQGAIKSGNPLAATSVLPSLGMSNFSVSTGLR